MQAFYLLRALDVQTCANRTAATEPSWLHIPEPGGVSEAERRKRVPGQWHPAFPPILSTSGSARPKAEGNSGSVMPVAECGAPQKSEERGERCMFNEKHLKRKED